MAQINPDRIPLWSPLMGLASNHREPKRSRFGQGQASRTRFRSPDGQHHICRPISSETTPPSFSLGISTTQLFSPLACSVMGADWNTHPRQHMSRQDTTNREACRSDCTFTTDIHSSFGKALSTARDWSDEVKQIPDPTKQTSRCLCFPNCTLSRPNLQAYRLDMHLISPSEKYLIYLVDMHYPSPQANPATPS